MEAAIRELAAATGERLADAVETAMRERLQRVKRRSKPDNAAQLLERLKPIREAIAAERRLRKDTRTPRQLPNELYDEHGLPK